MLHKTIIKKDIFMEIPLNVKDSKVEAKDDSNESSYCIALINYYTQKKADLERRSEGEEKHASSQPKKPFEEECSTYEKALKDWKRIAVYMARVKKCIENLKDEKPQAADDNTLKGDIRMAFNRLDEAINNSGKVCDGSSPDFRKIYISYREFNQKVTESSSDSLVYWTKRIGLVLGGILLGMKLGGIYGSAFGPWGLVAGTAIGGVVGFFGNRILCSSTEKLYHATQDLDIALSKSEGFLSAKIRESH
jgi:hypothetical protein